jgi:hypothetical protein
MMLDLLDRYISKVIITIADKPKGVAIVTPTLVKKVEAICPGMASRNEVRDRKNRRPIIIVALTCARVPASIWGIFDILVRMEESYFLEFSSKSKSSS